LNRLNAALAKLDAEILHAGPGSLRATSQAHPPAQQKPSPGSSPPSASSQSKFDVAITTLSESETATPRITHQDSTAGRNRVPVRSQPRRAARPLRAIASSGEMARVMLALQDRARRVDEIPVLIFDEVDANVGGETANAVGEKMLQIAKQRQVLCNYPSRARGRPFGRALTVVASSVRRRTISEIALLEKKDRVTELAACWAGNPMPRASTAEALLACREAHSNQFTVEAASRFCFEPWRPRPAGSPVKASSVGAIYL